jgi:hypothetical protein
MRQMLLLSGADVEKLLTPALRRAGYVRRG